VRSDDDGAGVVTFRSLDPAYDEVVWEGHAASDQECAAAVARARAAFPTWRRTPLPERTAILDRYADLLRREAEPFAELIARETGKPLWEARTEVGTMIGKIALSIAARGERAADRSSATDFGAALLQHRPHGVMAVLGPYNFPGHLPNGHIGPALLAGNSVVFKPSEHTPAVGERMVELLREAGLPLGAIELLQGARETGAALLACDIDGVLFTGSATGGRGVRHALVDRPKVIAALELGGNNPLIAWDGDPEFVADIVAQSAFITTGQRCSCARRLIVPQGPAGDRTIEALVTRTDGLRVGAWNELDEPFMGPLIAHSAAQTAVAAEVALTARGARRLRPLSRMDRSPAFVSPGILDVTAIDIPDEEVFAPLLTVYRATNFAQAIALANQTRFGLAAGLITNDDELWGRFTDEVRAGVVNRNRPTTGASGAMPFGGVGESGNHRPSAFYAADYCAYPVASLVAERVASIAALPGMTVRGSGGQSGPRSASR
jgi:succinylglutamic semialdehyde dehydrogenase